MLSHTSQLVTVVILPSALPATVHISNQVCVFSLSVLAFAVFEVYYWENEERRQSDWFTLYWQVI